MTHQRESAQQDQGQREHQNAHGTELQHLLGQRQGTCLGEPTGEAPADEEQGQGGNEGDDLEAGDKEGVDTAH